MTITERTRRNYEDCPYPTTSRRVVTTRFDHLPPLKWVQAMGGPGEAVPRRVLVAGCGSGAEAFELRRALPDAAIVAIDLSPRSIAVARHGQRQARLARPVRFAVADLTNPQLAAQTGSAFDLVSCHGVLSYIPHPERVLVNLAACVRPGGLLYLGVNGTRNPSARLRRWLPQFGVSVDALEEERRLRELLRLWDALYREQAPALAGLSASYLASDVCGAHFNNWSLARWRDTARRAGWSLAASWHLPIWLRQTLEGSAHRPLFPAKLSDLPARLDAASPAAFHRLVFRRSAEAEWRWDGSVPSRPSELRWTGLYSLKFTPPRRGKSTWAVMRCPMFNLKLEWPLSPREAAAAGALAGARGSWIAWPAGWPRTEAARRTLWLWAGFGVISVRAAEGANAGLTAKSRSRITETVGVA